MSEDLSKICRLRPGKKRKSISYFMKNNEDKNPKHAKESTTVDDIPYDEVQNDDIVDIQLIPHLVCKGYQYPLAEIPPDMLHKAILYKFSICEHHETTLFPFQTLGAFSCMNDNEIITAGYIALDNDPNLVGQFTQFCFFISANCTHIQNSPNACDSCSSFFKNSIYWKIYRAQSIDSIKEERDVLKAEKDAVTETNEALEHKCELNNVKIISLKSQIERYKKTNVSEVYNSWMENEKSNGRSFNFGNFKKAKDRKGCFEVLQFMSDLYEKEYRNDKTSENYLTRMELFKRSLGNT